jgi:hypothetical protein
MPVMRFGQLDSEIQQCEQHLDESGARNTEIENHIVRYLLVRICAEYERRIEVLVQRRCARINDQYVLNFANWGIEMATKRFKIENIMGLLSRFGEDYQRTFKDALGKQGNKQNCQIAWDNIVTNRHIVAHGKGPVMMTLTDLKGQYNCSLVVIDGLVKALHLREKDIAGLK